MGQAPLTTWVCKSVAVPAITKGNGPLQFNTRIAGAVGDEIFQRFATQCRLDIDLVPLLDVGHGQHGRAGGRMGRRAVNLEFAVPHRLGDPRLTIDDGDFSLQLGQRSDGVGVRGVQHLGQRDAGLRVGGITAQHLSHFTELLDRGGG
jgi:hypothetical protein